MALPLGYSLRNLWQRKTRTALTVSVIALAVIAASLLLGLVSSLKRTLVSTGDPQNLIVLRKGSDNDGSSALSLEALQNVRFFEGIARDAAGNPLISPEMVVQPFFHRPDGGRENVLVRGVEPIALEVHREVHVTQGRMFTPSTQEIIVGRGIAQRYPDVAIGRELRFGRGHWTVVGIFDAGGSSYESEVWTDVRQLAADAKRTLPYSGFRLRVADGADRDALARRIGDDPRWALEAQRETDYYAEQAESTRNLYALVVLVALLAGVGAAFGATNTMYAAVAARTAEIGTLRALGFSSRDVLRAFLVEALGLSALGLAIGGTLAALGAAALSSALGGIGFGAATFTTNVIQLRVGGTDLALAAAFAAAIGVVGGIFPAWRASQLRPVDALRRA